MDVPGESVCPHEPRVALIGAVARGCGRITSSWRCRAESSDQKEMLSLNLIAAAKSAHSAAWAQTEGKHLEDAGPTPHS